MNLEKVNCLVLAGGSGDSPLEKRGGVSSKALIKMKDGREMIRFIIETMQELKELKEITVIGPEELQDISSDYGAKFVIQEDCITDNIIKGSKVFQKDKSIIVSSSDIPFISKEAISDFLERSYPGDHDFYYPLISKECFPPEIKKTFVTLKEGTFAGGNIFRLNPKKLQQFGDLTEKIMMSRKRPLKMASLFGIAIPFLYLVGGLSIDKILDRINRYNISAKPIFSHFFELGMDVDDQHDLETIEEIMKNRPFKERV